MSLPNDTSALDPKDAILDVTVPARQPWSGRLQEGQIMRIVDLEGRQAVDALFYRWNHFAERYSAQDTVLEQGTPYISQGSALYSNEGGVMAVLTADSCGNHDTSAGACSCEANTVRFGHHTKYMHACRENFVLEVGKYGMTKRDVVGNVNFFMNVPISPDGELAIVDGLSTPGGAVDFQAKMDLLVVFSNCPQVNNPCNGFTPTPIRVLIWEAPVATITRNGAVGLGMVA